MAFLVELRLFVFRQVQSGQRALQVQVDQQHAIAQGIERCPRFAVMVELPTPPLRFSTEMTGTLRPSGPAP